MSTEAKPNANAKELLDTMLGYLGFVVQIEETRSESGNPTLQIYTEEADRLIGRDGETLDAIQFLLNRVLQAKESRARRNGSSIAKCTARCARTKSCTTSASWRNASAFPAGRSNSSR